MAFLSILWEMFPHHKNLPPSLFEKRALTGDYVQKPLFSREGANVLLSVGGNIYKEVDAHYGQEGYIYQ